MSAPIDALARVEAFVDNLFTEGGSGDVIRAYLGADGVRRLLTEADMRAVISIARLATGPGIPAADYPGVWAELTGHVQQAADDGEPIDAAALLAYLRELRRKALTPVREWMRRIQAAASEPDDTEGA